ncbi:ABC transporter ATP-binding protein [Saliniramus fredricksonii]|uniref:Iron complex transport system ATP-binding protein n=1 Tax=Saliniramus fredricksonii TaxID=1653334 RepID=A0ABY0KD89_9HYPH|nr:ABC transporter ATP-binding protein [Saliniramus fredricksonii]SCC82352.1 iron complex transport system ATP-binding protein [Saliniramus fredricksonii]
MITARELTIGHGATVVGQGLSLSISLGEVICLLGPNGCGKTTLFRTLLGLIPPITGAIAIGGRDIAALRRRDIARAVAYVPQAHVPPFPYLVEEVVLMGRTARIGPLSAPSAGDRDIARAALARLGIADLAQSDYSRLSGGQRQMVMIARALAQQAPLLIMDEPTASLDFGNQARVLTRIADLARAGDHGVILSTHDPDQAFALDARVILMHEGVILADGPPEKVLTASRLTDVYGVPVRVERTESGSAVCAPWVVDASTGSGLQHHETAITNKPPNV